ncbi:MAG: hypothetical protein PHF87_05780 [Desulfotomaculaceae bacterium]|nr:hypothetical protein [Desulfotomaculaceae bacterium]
MNIFDNPFFVLGATTRDNRRKIIELADEKNLSSDSDRCLQARNDLTNPRKRLAAEISWFPGVSPKRIEGIITYLTALRDHELVEEMDIWQFEGIARLTIAINQLRYKEHADIFEAGYDILHLNSFFEEINTERMLSLLNEERLVSGFPMIDSPSLIADELRNVRSEINEIINQKLQLLSQEEYMHLATMIAKECYESEESVYEDGVVVEDFLNSYQLNIKDTLDTGMQQIVTSRENIIENVTNDDLDIQINELINLVSQWDMLAQPLQLIARYKGTKHIDSENLAYIIRDLAIDLNNTHYKTDQSIKLISTLQDVFAELPEFAERIEEDNESLQRIKLGQIEQEKENQEMIRHNSENKLSVLMGIFVMLFVAVLCFTGPLSSLFGNSNSVTTTKPTNNTSTKNSSKTGTQTKQQRLNTMKNEIDAKLVIMKIMENDLDDLTSDLDHYERLYYSTGSEMYIDRYNRAYEDYQSLYNQYDKTIVDYNRLVEEYNKGI